MAEAESSNTESLLWTCKECYVYQIPPLRNESGHRANGALTHLGIASINSGSSLHA